MLLCGRQNKNSVGRWFFQCFEKRIKSSVRQHVNLIDDIYLKISDLRRISYLVDQVTNIFNGIVGSGIEFEDVEGIVFGAFFEFVDQACNNAGTGSFTNASWPAE